VDNSPPVTSAAPSTSIASVPAPAPGPDKKLVLTASRDSFVQVSYHDGPDTDKPIYAAVLHGGQSVAFDGRRFSINVGVPSAVDIKLDGVNYGPHSEATQPETFTVESHQP
jgi:hypothetical protein